MKKIFAKIICCFVPFRGLRRLIRLKADVPVRKYVKYAKSFSSSKHPRIEVSCGYRGANLVVNVDDKYIFKFPRYGDARAISLREKQITDALRPISPIKIPEMQILHFNGVYVRKYEYVKGIGFHFLDKETQIKHAKKIGQQLADFLYVVGMSDPVAIRDLKPKKSEKPSMMYGWSQNDLWDNFLMDNETYDIVAAIDWEDARFGDFCAAFTREKNNTRVQEALLRAYIQKVKSAQK